MLEKAAAFFGLVKQSEYVGNYLKYSNMEVMHLLSAVFAIASSFLALTTIAPIPPWSDMTPDRLAVYRAMLFAFFAVSVVAHFITSRYFKRGRPSSFLVDELLFSYIFVMLGLSIGLTLYDYPNTERFLIFVAMLVLLFGLFHIAPFNLLCVFVAALAVMICALNTMGYNDYSVRVVLYAYVILAFIVSSSNYQSQLRAARASEKIKALSIYDTLTNTKNRRALDEDDDYLCGEPLYLMITDVDEFKFYNDAFGHAAGDTILVEFASALKGAFGEGNVYRFGGDEFVAVKRTTSLQDFKDAVDSWRDTFKDVKVGDGRRSPTMSGGYVYGTPNSIDEFYDMLRFADARLYDAKQAGRDQILGSSYGRTLGEAPAALA